MPPLTTSLKESHCATLSKPKIKAALSKGCLFCCIACLGAVLPSSVTYGDSFPRRGKPLGVQCVSKAFPLRGRWPPNGRSDEVLVRTATLDAVRTTTPFLSARAERNRVEPGVRTGALHSAAAQGAPSPYPLPRSSFPTANRYAGFAVGDGDFDFPLWKPLKTTKRAPALLDFPA